jgi:hypothetical protein
VIRQNEALKARYADRYTAEPGTDPVDPPTPEASTTTPPADPPPAPPAPPADPREADPAYWKQRFQVTEGLLKAEREHRKNDAGALRQQVLELQEQVRSLQAAATQAQPASEVDLGQFFTPEQVEQIGEDEAKAIAQAAMRAATATAKQAIEAEIKPLRDARVEDAKQAAEERKVRFLDALAELVPDYAEIDQRDDWKAWLAADDGANQALLDLYISKANPVKVAGLFQGFQKTLEPPAPPVAPRGTGAAAGNTPPAQPGLTPPTPAEIRDFYKRSTLKRVSDQERAQFEARLKLRAGR